MNLSQKKPLQYPPPRVEPSKKPAPTAALPRRIVGAAAMADDTSDAARGVREMVMAAGKAMAMVGVGTGLAWRGEGDRRRRNTRGRI